MQLRSPFRKKLEWSARVTRHAAECHLKNGLGWEQNFWKAARETLAATGNELGVLKRGRSCDRRDRSSLHEPSGSKIHVRWRCGK
jgi:hypothetical protein